MFLAYQNVQIFATHPLVYTGMARHLACLLKWDHATISNEAEKPNSDRKVKLANVCFVLSVGGLSSPHFDMAGLRNTLIRSTH